MDSSSSILCTTNTMEQIRKTSSKSCCQLGGSMKKKKMKSSSSSPLKVVYISNPIRFKATASEFRALVQELTGQDSDLPHPADQQFDIGVGGSSNIIASSCNEEEEEEEEDEKVVPYDPKRSAGRASLPELHQAATHAMESSSMVQPSPNNGFSQFRLLDEDEYDDDDAVFTPLENLSELSPSGFLLL